MDPHRVLLQIRKVICLDYRENSVICGPTGGAKPRSSSSPCAPSPADLPRSGQGLLESSKVTEVVDNVFRPTL
jgi:hypothetical protein